MELTKRFFGNVAGALLIAGCSDGTVDIATRVDDLTIDDFEDGDNTARLEGGRDGLWYCYNDEAPDGDTRDQCGNDFQQCPSDFQSRVFEEPGDRAGGGLALHMCGRPFIEWGAGVGVSLVEQGQTYDLKRFKALRFWAKARDGAGAAPKIRVNFPNDDTEGDVDPSHFGTSVLLTTGWNRHEISLGALSQEVPTGPLAFEATTVTNIQFLFGADLVFDLWLDDLEFVLASDDETP